MYFSDFDAGATGRAGGAGDSGGASDASSSAGEAQSGQDDVQRQEALLRAGDRADGSAGRQARASLQLPQRGRDQQAATGRRFSKLCCFFFCHCFGEIEPGTRVEVPFPVVIVE